MTSSLVPFNGIKKYLPIKTAVSNQTPPTAHRDSRSLQSHVPRVTFWKITHYVAAELVGFAPAFISVSFSVEMTATQLNDSLGVARGWGGGFVIG